MQENGGIYWVRREKGGYNATRVVPAVFVEFVGKASARIQFNDGKTRVVNLGKLRDPARYEAKNA